MVTIEKRETREMKLLRTLISWLKCSCSSNTSVQEDAERRIELLKNHINKATLDGESDWMLVMRRNFKKEECKL